MSDKPKYVKQGESIELEPGDTVHLQVPVPEDLMPSKGLALSDMTMNQIECPQDSNWECLLFGSDDESGIVWNPPEEQVPNWFQRLMMRWFFACRWVRKDTR